MKKRLNSITMTLVCLLLLSVGCSKEADAGSGEGSPGPSVSANPFDVALDNSGTVTESAYTYGPVVRTFVYDGTPIQLEYEIDNTGPPCEVGLLVFVDGIVQSYRLDTDDSEKFVHAFDLEEGKSIRPTLYIDPSVGANGQTLYMGITVIFNPSFRQDVKVPTAYGHKLACSTATYVSVEYRADSKQALAKSRQESRAEEIPQSLIDYYKSQSMSFDNLNFRIENLTGFEEAKLKANVGDSCRFTLSGAGGEEKDYRLCLFLDTTPYVFKDGSTYIDFPIKKDKVTSADIELDLSDWPEGASATLHAVLIPIVNDIEDYSGFSTQTARFLLVKGAA
jgi:hypothetical protein